MILFNHIINCYGSATEDQTYDFDKNMVVIMLGGELSLITSAEFSNNAYSDFHSQPKLPELPSYVKECKSIIEEDRNDEYQQVFCYGAEELDNQQLKFPSYVKECKSIIEEDRNDEYITPLNVLSNFFSKFFSFFNCS